MSYFFQWIFFLATLGLLWSAGCEKRDEPIQVNFSNTVPIKRPSEINAASQEELRIAIGAMVSPKETLSSYQDLLNYLALKLGKRLVLVQRKTYGQINEMLGQGDVDLAFLCSGPYVAGKNKYGFELLAAPEVKGSHFYNAYLIVNRNSGLEGLGDLKGKTFAFTDPDSNTGYLAPIGWLKKLGTTPEEFFGSTVYTYSHDNSILAVSKGLVEGASVDGLIWDFYTNSNSEMTGKTRVIYKSEDFGIPPVVAGKHVSGDTKLAVKRALFQMREDPEGAAILDKLMIDRFVEADDSWYDSIRRTMQVTAGSTVSHHGLPKPKD
jgi:phosphonate transport system substrate-binding protein